MVLTALVAIAAQAASSPLYLFVATNGLPSNPGTKSEPFGTIEQARDHIRSLIDGGLQNDVRVMVRGGTYRLTNAISFGPEDTISPTNSVTYLAYPGEEPILSGGRQITGWTTNGSVWRVSIPEVASGDWSFRELFVNGERRPRAREPNTGFFRVSEAGPDKHTSFEYYPDDLSIYTNLSAAELVFFHDWCVSRVEIDHVDFASNIVYLSSPIGLTGLLHGDIDHFEPHPRYYVEGHINLLDSPGEWHLADDGLLTYWPMPGEQISSASVVAPFATALMVCAGSPEQANFVRNIHFQGMTFSHCSWGIPSFGYAAYQAGVYEQRPLPPNLDIYKARIPAAVKLLAAQDCSVSDCRFIHLGGSALSVRQSSQNILISGNEVRDVAANGIMVGEMKGLPFAERDRLTGEWNLWWSEHPEWVVSETVVSNNSVHGCGTVFPGSVGIWVGVAESAKVYRNSVGDLPYTGISVGWVWDDRISPCVSNIVERNTMSNVLQLLSDGGGIYTLGRQPGTVVHDNIIHTVHPTQGRAGNNGIFVDSGSVAMLFAGNIIYAVESNACVRFNGPGSNIFRANTLVPEDGFAAFASSPDVVTFIDNMVEDPSTWAPPNAEELGIGLYPPDADGNGLADVWEVAYLGNSGQPPSADLDEDGADLLNEFVSGTDPFDQDSVLHLGISLSGASPVLELETKRSAGVGYRSMVRHYTIEHSSSPADPDWASVYGLEWIVASNSVARFHPSGGAGNSFYRVRATLE